MAICEHYSNKNTSQDSGKILTCGFGIGLSLGIVGITVEPQNCFPVFRVKERYDDGLSLKTISEDSSRREGATGDFTVTMRGDDFLMRAQDALVEQAQAEKLLLLRPGEQGGLADEVTGCGEIDPMTFVKRGYAKRPDDRGVAAYRRPAARVSVAGRVARQHGAVGAIAEHPAC